MDSANRGGKYYYDLPAGSPRGNPDWPPLTLDLNPISILTCTVISMKGKSYVSIRPQWLCRVDEDCIRGFPLRLMTKVIEGLAEIRKYYVHYT